METEVTTKIATMQDKISKVRKSCITPDHRKVYQRYRELYSLRMKEFRESYQKDLTFRAKVDGWMLLISGFLCWLILAVLFCMAIANAIKY